MLGLYEGALKFEENALELRKKFFEEQHPDILASKKNVASIYQRLGKYDKALAELAGALRILNKTDMEEKKLEFKKLIADCIGIKKTFEIINHQLNSADEAKNTWERLQSLSKKKVKDYNLIKKAYLDADQNYISALKLSKEIFNEELALKCLQGLKVIYEKSNNIIAEQKTIEQEIEVCIRRIEKAKALNFIDLAQQLNTEALQNDLSKFLPSHLEQDSFVLFQEALNPVPQELSPLAGALNNQQNEGMLLASDPVSADADLLGV
jgi:tetratricopeptide (TPR) repeat protein